MFTIRCEKCNNRLILDEMSTRDEYLKDASCLFDDSGDLLEESIQQYLIYRCIECEEIFKLTYEDWEKLFRKELAIEVMNIKKYKMFNEDINPHIIDPDNGMEFCGQCGGIEDGNCFVDIIKQCTIRKK